MIHSYGGYKGNAKRKYCCSCLSVAQSIDGKRAPSSSPASLCFTPSRGIRQNIQKYSGKYQADEHLL
jgi:hypothetical protein